ncbi:MAG: peptidylprolyl isomerase [Armatimonadota bacterium]|nr:peptidylprolyl isomerase [bacterium]
MRLFFMLILMSLISAMPLLAAEPVNTGKPETGRWAVIETDKGTIKFALYEKDAPITTKNFIDLAERKFYDGLTFHRVVEGFVVQGGDPNGDGTGSSEKKIPLEVSPKLKHDTAGIVAMARRSDPNSASCQFYITLAAVPYLDMQYAVFGRVVEGIDVVKKLKIGDVMKTVRIIPAPKPEEPTKKQDPKK